MTPTVVFEGRFFIISLVMQDTDKFLVKLPQLHQPVANNSLESFRRQKEANPFARNHRFLAPLEICDWGLGYRRPWYEDNILKSTSPTQPPDYHLLDRIIQVAQALAYLHEHQTVHGHVYPGNIFLTAGGAAVVADACIYSHVRASASMPPGKIWIPEGVSIFYQSPEFFTQRVLEPPSDVYAFGSTIYAVMTGRNPWGVDSNDPKSIEDALREMEEYGHSRIGRPLDIGEELWDLLEQCWHREPVARPTMNELIRDLEDIQLYHTS